MSTTISNEIKLSQTLDRIQKKSLNNKSLKKELQNGMNNILNTYMAFNRISSNTGAGTHGIDGQTIDSFNLNRIKRYHWKYVNNQYIPKPVKRVHIPKGKGETRPLGIPTIEDRIIQKAMEQLLTPYFENIFSEWSYGFRSNKSCLDAIKRVKQRFKGIDYIIKIDIKGYFDSINHEILLKMLNKHIKKIKTLSTIERWLKAGIMENGVTYESLSGSPQGGIISPLLANVYLQYIDVKMEKLIKDGTPRKKKNPAYCKLYYKKVKDINVESYINLNPETRVEYIRYADDFIIGIEGDYNRAVGIREKVTNWLTQDLNLKISRDKTKIVKANKGTRFLSYMIKVNSTNRTRKKKNCKSSNNGKVQVQVPKSLIKEYGYEYGWIKDRKITRDASLTHRDAIEIMRTYKTIIRGIIQYFCLAGNISQLTHLSYIAEYSCLKTLAGKGRKSLAEVRKKYQIGGTWGVKYDYRGKPKMELWEKYDWNRIKKMRGRKGNLNTTPNQNLWKGRTSLITRLQAQKCEVCLTKDIKLEIHHTKTVRDANWRSIMSKQTIVLCKNCHRKRTNQQIRDITNFKRNKAKKTVSE